MPAPQNYMPTPQNYMLNLPDPGQQMLQGYATGLKIDATQQALEQKRAEAQAAQAQAAQQQQIISSITNNPNPSAQDFKNAVLGLPKDQAEAAQKIWDMQNDDQKQNQLKLGSDIMSALNTGNESVAMNLLKTRASAERNSGNEQKARLYESYAEIAKTNPDIVYKSIGISMSALPGGDKVIEGITKLGGAGFKGQEIDIERQKLDLRRTENQLRAMESGLKRETNELKKEELQQNIEKKRQDLDQKKREIVSESETSYKNTSNALALTDDILTNVDIDAISGLQALTPTVLPETQDALNKVMQLKNQLTLDNLKLMTGVLTDRDIQVLSSAASGLIVDEKGIKGSPEGVKKQLKKIRDTLRGKLDIAGKGLEKVKKDFGIQPAQEAPAGAVSQEVLNRMQKYLPGGQ